MMYVFILVPVLTLLLGGVGGYYLGRYQSHLVEEIARLRLERSKPTPEKPTITAGAYAQPAARGNIPDKQRKAGLVEAKTPEQMEWEAKQEFERQLQRGL